MNRKATFEDLATAQVSRAQSRCIRLEPDDKIYKRYGNIGFLKRTEYVFITLILALLIIISGFSKNNNNKIDGNWWSCIKYDSSKSNIYVEYYYVDDSILASYDVIAGYIMSYYRVEGDTIIFYNSQKYIIDKLFIKEITPEKLLLESTKDYSITMHKLKCNINVSKLLSNQLILQDEFAKEFFLRRDSLRKYCNCKNNYQK
jgi:hypothetical protein